MNPLFICFKGFHAVPQLLIIFSLMSLSSEAFWALIWILDLKLRSVPVCKFCGSYFSNKTFCKSSLTSYSPLVANSSAPALAFKAGSTHAAFSSLTAASGSAASAPRFFLFSIAFSSASFFSPFLASSAAFLLADSPSSPATTFSIAALASIFNF